METKTKAADKAVAAPTVKVEDGTVTASLSKPTKPKVVSKDTNGNKIEEN